MDGFGLNPESTGNAIAAASTPNFDRLLSKYPHTALGASGLDVGLPDGQMGNSEVGHLNFGAGRVVFQEVTRIDKAIADDSFFKNDVLLEQIVKIKNQSGKLHLMGLASDGLVHSSLQHLYALLILCKQQEMKNVVIHAFLDGRDTSPTSGAGHVEDIMVKCAEIGIGSLGSVIGRYYAMDRDNRWQRTKKAYDLVVAGVGLKTSRPVAAVKEYYSKNTTDEFMEPISVDGFEHGLAQNDGVIFYNFRADRARQLSYALTDNGFDSFDRNGGPVVPLVSLTQYDVKLKAKVAFEQVLNKNIFGEVISAAGITQLRTAETEKYPHVTFFFNGGIEESFEGEDRVMIHSPNVATYDLKPEMSALEVTGSTLGKIEENKYDVIILNYANCDMVGHTGIIDAAIKAVETVDSCAGRVVDSVLKAGGVAMVTADHGNCEKMLDDNGEPHTAHTTFPVPFVLVDDNFDGKLRQGAVLADVAPTMLEFLKIPRPDKMTGESLLVRSL
jgi:2,3-bisphosphoglycerate-independent phosphoglycerate mutase